MKTYLVIVTKGIEVEADSDEEACEKVGDWLVANDPEASIEMVQEL